MTRRLRAAGGLALGAALLACSAEPGAPGPPPPTPRAAVVLEPPSVEVGRVAQLEIAVVTPPGQRVKPPPTPAEVPGFWVLDQEVLPVEQLPGRWIHRSRVRLRAREVGRFAWPALEVELEDAAGALSTLALEERPLEVVSVLPELPERLTPFGLAAPRPRSGGGSLAPAAAGALLALAGVGAAGLLRRRAAARRAARARAAPPPAPAWDEARLGLDAALEALAADPAGAADRAARALRRYMARRFGADAVARTTEELAALRPPYGARSWWPPFLEILRTLDAARFPPAPARERLGDALRRAGRFVEDSTPPEGLR